MKVKFYFRQYLLICVVFTAIYSIAQETTIKGQFYEKFLPQKIYLSENIGGKYQIIDSAIIKENKEFKFQGAFETGYYAIWLDKSNWAQFILNNQDTLIEINFTARQLRNGTHVKQSIENKLLWQFIENRKIFQKSISQYKMQKSYFSQGSNEYLHFDKKEDSLIASYNEYLLELYGLYTHSFFAKTIISDYIVNDSMDFFKYVLFENEELIRSGVLTRKITEYLQLHTDFTEKGFKNSIDNILKLSEENLQVYDFTLNYLLELFNKVGPDIILDYLIENYILREGCTDLEYTDVLKQKLDSYQRIQIGKTISNISLINEEGIMQNMLDICNETKINVLFFGSSNCHFCQDAYPKLSNHLLINQEYNELINIIYYSLDQKIEDWNKTIELLPTTWKKLTELKGWDSKGVDLFQVHKTPTFYILDSKLRIIGKPADVHELIKEIKFLTKT